MDKINDANTCKNEIDNANICKNHEYINDIVMSGGIFVPCQTCKTCGNKMIDEEFSKFMLKKCEEFDIDVTDIDSSSLIMQKLPEIIYEYTHIQGIGVLNITLETSIEDISEYLQSNYVAL